MSVLDARPNAQTHFLELKRSYDDAQKAIRARDDALAIVSHDLRGPLHSLSLHLDAMLTRVSHDGPRAVDRAPLESARRAVDTMKRMVADLLDVSKLDSGHFPMEACEHNIASLVGESIESFSSGLLDKSIAIDLSLDGNCHRAIVDKDRMLQVFSNLLENAIRFTPEGGVISVRIAAGLNSCLISVADSGAGIPPEQIARVFDRYWQAEGKGRGTAGLGLYIAQRIVEAHGGTIAVESEVGQGTTFQVRLPTCDTTRTGAPPRTICGSPDRVAGMR
jgi:signal transduction histidine kinase